MRITKVIILSLLLAAAVPVFAVDKVPGWFDSETPSVSLPTSRGLASYFGGVSNGALTVAGGSWFEDGADKRSYGDAIFVLPAGSGTWQLAGNLDTPLAYGASVPFQDGILCLGGEFDDNPTDKVFLLRWNGSLIEIDDDYPPLPAPATKLSAAVLGKTVHVIAGNRFWKYDPDKKTWEELPAPPFTPRYGAVMLSQSNGVNDCLYYFGGKDSTYHKDAWRYDPSMPVTGRWNALPDAPYPLSFAPSVTFRTSELFIFSGSTGSDTDGNGEFHFPTGILSYNTITNTWCKAGDMECGVVNASAIPWNGGIIIPGGETRPRERTSSVSFFKLRDHSTSSFNLWDYLALFAYLLLIVALSVFFSRKTKSTKDFFLGGQKIPFWAAGLSLMAAQVSSIGFMSIPAKSFVTNWSYFAGVLTWFIVVPIVIHVFVPFYRRLQVTSAYEYLETRFNVFIRKFVAFLYLLSQLLGRLGALIFLPAIALSAVTGINPLVSIIVIGGLATLYTVLGGMKAVIWIDVIQAMVLFGAIFLCIGFVIGGLDGGVGTVLRVASENDKFNFGRMDWDMTAAVFWVIVIGNIFNRIGSNATDQSVVQRYLTTKDEKETARALWTDALVSIPWALCVFGLGTALFVFYKLHPAMLPPAVSNDGIVPFFIGQNLPSGLRGIVIAGIFAASMSSVDSSIHSSTTVILKDFLSKFTNGMEESGKVRLARVVTFIIGALGTLIAVVMTFFDINSVWDIILEVAGLFTGAMTGVFLLGIFSTRANGKGAIVGVFSSALILMAVKTWTPLNFFLYSGIGIISCMFIGYLASLFFKNDKSTEGLTIYSVHDEI